MEVVAAGVAESAQGQILQQVWLRKELGVGCTHPVRVRGDLVHVRQGERVGHAGRELRARGQRGAGRKRAERVAERVRQGAHRRVRPRGLAVRLAAWGLAAPEIGPNLVALIQTISAR